MIAMGDQPTVDPHIQQSTIAALREDGEPTVCQRCGGKPGEPGCGKLVHAIMDGYYETVKQLMAQKEAQ